MSDRRFVDAAANWEGLAKEDALFAILTDEQKRGEWPVEDFFATGRAEIETVLDYLKLFSATRPCFSGRALDFGCGAGRLTQALAGAFARCDGVDISASMIDLARQYNQQGDACQFHLNLEPDLSLFEDHLFDFVYSSIVLQHIPARQAKAYIQEFVRVAAPGGILVFQEPDYEGRGRLKQLRRTVGLSRSNVARIRGWIQPSKKRHVMEMNGIPEQQVRQLLADAGAEVVDVCVTNSTRPSFFDGLELRAPKPARGAISKQYIVVTKAKD